MPAKRLMDAPAMTPRRPSAWRRRAAAWVAWTVAFSSLACAAGAADAPPVPVVSPVSAWDVCLLTQVLRINPMRDRDGMRRWYLHVGQDLSKGHTIAAATVRLDPARGHTNASVPAKASWSSPRPRATTCSRRA
ncbi:MAG: hypothetical protein NVS3B7_06690 [Candidatus Elarobacter sp.]